MPAGTPIQVRAGIGIASATMLTIGSSRLVLAAAAFASCVVLAGCEEQGGGSSSAGASPSPRPSSLAQRAAKSERPTSNPVQNGPRRATSTPKPAQGQTGPSGQSLSSVYANSLQVDAQHLVAADGARQSSCSGKDLAACRDALQQVSTWATALQRDLDAHPAPLCMKSADATLRSAIDLYLQGAQLGTKGIDDGSTTELSQGMSLLDQGTTRLTASSSQLGQSGCSAPPPNVAP